MFSDLTNLQDLYLENNELMTLPAGVFSGLANLEYLDLRSNALPSLPGALLDDLEARVGTVYLRGNPGYLGPGPFDFVRTPGPVGPPTPSGGICARTPQVRAGILKRIGIANCGNVTAADLRGITGLLDLADQGIASLQAGDFAGLTNLQRLFLYNNTLTMLPAGIFKGLTNLQTLSLAHNALTMLPADIFSGLTNLQVLDLSNNALPSLPGALLDDLEARVAFVVVDLRGNPGYLGPGLFDFVRSPGSVFCDRTPQVREGILKRIGIANCGNVTAADLREITGLLDLADQGIASLQAGDFAGLTNLEALFLTYNSLMTLPVGVFSGLTSLQNLSLGNPGLWKLPGTVFSDLTNLQVLQIGNTGLTTLPGTTYSGLTNLVTINLYSNDHLRTLPPGVFSGLTNLERIILRDNDLRTLPAGVFSDLANLQTLDLRNNALTSLPGALLDDLEARVGDVYLTGNPGYLGPGPFDFVRAPAPVDPESFSIRDRGGWSTTSSGTAETVRVGYGRIRADVGSSTPSGIAIFQFRDSQEVLISEASVPAAELIQAGRIFAEVGGPVNTGLAIANPNDEAAIIRFYFTDTDGTNVGSGAFELGAHQQTAKFLDQPPFNGGSTVLGTFTFESSAPIAVIALRGFTNEAGEFLMTTLPVAPLPSASEETVYFPHFAAGGGWVTQVILVNPTDSTITGTVGFLGKGSDTVAASPVILTLDDGSTGSEFDYSIPPRSSQRFTTSNPFGALNDGSVRATPNSGNAAPSGLVVFSYAPAGKTLSEAGVPTLPKGSGFRVYAEASGTPGQMGSIITGLAITNVADTSNIVTLEVTNIDGSLAVSPTTLALPPSGQVARFLNEFFPSLTLPFSGILRIASTPFSPFHSRTPDIAVVGIRMTINERNDVLVTTTPPSEEDSATTSSDLFFPHFADSGGWTTQFILFSGSTGQTSSGTLSFIDASGQPLDLTSQP